MLAKQLQGSALATQPVFIEDTFSTHLYTGNGSTQTITNGIDLAGEGGMVWIKSRSAATNNFLFDTARGTTDELNSNTTDAEASLANSLTAFNADGFSIGSATGIGVNAATYASWTFRKQPKFFDVVTYTGDGVAGRTVAHNLGSVPGVLIVKRVDSAGQWMVYHRSLGNTKYLGLNVTDAETTSASAWNNTTPTSTVFTLGDYTNTNNAGTLYVAYLFAHDAGGFGLTGTDNVISCGSAATDGSGNWTTTLGYEPQWVLWKAASTSGLWEIIDNMRNFSVTDNLRLFPNNSNAEASAGGPYLSPNATGFRMVGGGGPVSGTIIYIAIRRGPMRTPTSGTSVFGLSARTGTGANATVTGSAGVSDAVLVKNRGSAVASLFSSRLTGTGYLVTSTTAAEVAAATTILQANPWDVMDGVKVGTTSTITNASANTYINYLFDRAPGFFDVVCYTGTGVTNRTVTHNLTTAPQLLFVKARNNVQNWSALCTLNSGLQGRLNTTDALSAPSAAVWGNGSSYVAPTSSVFTVGTDNETNASTWTYVAYLFATVAGVSKVFSFTGNGSSQTINCGFTAGARLVLIKRTDSTGDWYIWDSSRGIVSGNDPHLSLNTTAAEVTTDDSVDADSTGFIVNQLSATNVNVNNATYIGLAIA